MSTSSARTHVRLLLLAAGVAVVLALGGCSSDDADSTAPDTAQDTASDSPSPAPTSGPTGAQRDWPSCADTWTDGAKLPGGYDGCLDGGKSGEAIKADRYPCSSGQRLITFDDQYYATAGGTISRTKGPVQQDGGFRQVLAVCQG